MPFKIMAVGEVLWDLLPSGRLLGGAPANYMYHVHALGADAQFVTAVGSDVLGHDMIATLASSGISLTLISTDSQQATGTVSVELSLQGQPSYVIQEDVAWDHIPATEPALRSAAQVDAICFGTLAQRHPVSRQSVRDLIASTQVNCLRVFDINLRAPFYKASTIIQSLELAHVLKLNDQELLILAGMLGYAGDQNEVLNAIIQRFDLRLIALTKGVDGSVLATPSARSTHPGFSTYVQDTIGAGDAFSAAMTLGLLRNWDLGRINQRANEVAAFVCSRPGGTPDLPQALTMHFH